MKVDLDKVWRGGESMVGSKSTKKNSLSCGVIWPQKCRSVNFSVAFSYRFISDPTLLEFRQIFRAFFYYQCGRKKRHQLVFILIND
jgi:hypothetical protein